MINTHTIIADMRQNISKIREDTGSQNGVVRGVHVLYRFSIRANCCLDSEQVRNLDYRDIRV